MINISYVFCRIPPWRRPEHHHRTLSKLGWLYSFGPPGLGFSTRCKRDCWSTQCGKIWALHHLQNHRSSFNWSRWYHHPDVLQNSLCQTLQGHGSTSGLFHSCKECSISDVEPSKLNLPVNQVWIHTCKTSVSLLSIWCKQHQVSVDRPKNGVLAQQHGQVHWSHCVSGYGACASNPGPDKRKWQSIGLPVYVFPHQPGDQYSLGYCDLHSQW